MSALQHRDGMGNIFAVKNSSKTHTHTHEEGLVDTDGLAGLSDRHLEGLIASPVDQVSPATHALLRLLLPLLLPP